MQTITIDKQKFIINQELNVIAVDGIKKLVQLGSGAWCLGLTNPPSYVTSEEDIKDLDIPKVIKERILRDVANRNKRIEEDRERQAKKAEQMASMPSAQIDCQDESVNALVSCIQAMTPEDRWGLFDVIKKHLSIVQDSITQGPEVNSSEGYGQGQDLPVYQDKHPLTGTLHFRHPEVNRGVPLDDEENMIDADNPMALRAYERSLDSQESHEFDSEQYQRKGNDEPISLEDELDAEAIR